MENLKLFNLIDHHFSIYFERIKGLRYGMRMAYSQNPPCLKYIDDAYDSLYQYLKSYRRVGEIDEQIKLIAGELCFFNGNHDVVKKYINSEYKKLKGNLKAWNNEIEKISKTYSIEDRIYTSYNEMGDYLEYSYEYLIELFAETLAPEATAQDRTNRTEKPCQIPIPETILQLLQTTICSDGKPFIEDATANPLKWLQNKQLLRELLTCEKIKGSFSISKIKKQTPDLFIDKNGKKFQLANAKKNPNNPDHKRLMKILATL